jgi:IS5 family transposase
MRNKQISLAEAVAGFSRRKKVCKAVGMLAKISEMVNWSELATIVSVLDKTQTGKGGRPPIDFEVKLKMLFLQYTFNLSDEELEDQLIDRLSFQQFIGLGYDEEIPDFTTIWHFKEGLVKLELMDKIFVAIVSQIEKHGLILKKGTMVDAMIIESSNRPLSNKRREELAKKPSKQIDTDAKSTIKNGKKYFGYKGHVGVDAQSKLIRKRTFTAANRHDSQELENVVSGDEKSIWADKAYPNKEAKQKARAKGIYYGILDKATRGKKLSTKQQKRNRQKSKVRASVEHVFGFMKKKLKVIEVGAKSKLRNALRFDMWCIIYNINRASFLLKKQKPELNCA